MVVVMFTVYQYFLIYDRFSAVNRSWRKLSSWLWKHRLFNILCCKQLISNYISVELQLQEERFLTSSLCHYFPVYDIQVLLHKAMWITYFNQHILNKLLFLVYSIIWVYFSSSTSKVYNQVSLLISGYKAQEIHTRARRRTFSIHTSTRRKISLSV